MSRLNSRSSLQQTDIVITMIAGVVMIVTEPGRH